jgi:hypothetical protein
MSTRTADLGAQIAQQRERLTDTVGALAEKIDTHEIAEEVRQTAKTKDGKRGLVIGLVVGLIGLIIVRRLLG